MEGATTNGTASTSRTFLTPPGDDADVNEISTLVPALLAVGVLVLVSAFFSSSESAVFSLSADWIAAASADGETADERALRDLRDDPHRLLVTILVGNNVVNVAISSIVTVVVAGRLSGGLAVTVATVVASFVVLVFGEIIPKSYGLGHAREWSLTVARPIRLVETVLSPLVTAFDALTRLGTAIGGDPDIEEPYTDDE